MTCLIKIIHFVFSHELCKNFHCSYRMECLADVWEWNISDNIFLVNDHSALQWFASWYDGSLLWSFKYEKRIIDEKLPYLDVNRRNICYYCFAESFALNWMTHWQNHINKSMVSFLLYRRQVWKKRTSITCHFR